MECQLRRRAGRPKKTTQASMVPPPVKNLPGGNLTAELAELVVTVRVEVTAPSPVTSAVAGDKLQATAEDAPDEAQDNSTLPVNPLVGVMLMVEVPELPAVTLMLPLLLRA